MSKVAVVLALVSCALIVGGSLTGCSAGALPGGTPGGSGATAGSSKPAGGAAPTANDLVAVPKDCPKASEVSALFGFTVPEAEATRVTGGLACAYAGTSGSHAAEINFHAAPSGTTAATVKAELESGASAGDVVAPVSGFGEAAFTAQPAGGGAVILVWNKGVEFSVVDGQDLESVERVALGILAG